MNETLKEIEEMSVVARKVVEDLSATADQIRAAEQSTTVLIKVPKILTGLESAVVYLPTGSVIEMLDNVYEAKQRLAMSSIDAIHKRAKALQDNPQGKAVKP